MHALALSLHRAHPDHDYLTFATVKLHRVCWRYADAIAIARAALARGPRPMTAIALAGALREDGDLDGAIAAFELARRVLVQRLAVVARSRRPAVRDLRRPDRGGAGRRPARAGRRGVATLRAGYQADLDDGAYEELDLAYGDLDPTLELARAYLVAGEVTAAEALLADREARWPSYFNHEEQVDTIRATRAAPPAARAGLHARFLRWAVGTEPEAEWAGLYEARWWLEGPLPDAVTPDAPLAALIASATMAEAVAAIATSPRTPAAVRAPAAARS